MVSRGNACGSRLPRAGGAAGTGLTRGKAGLTLISGLMRAESIGETPRTATTPESENSKLVWAIHSAAETDPSMRGLRENTRTATWPRGALTGESENVISDHLAGLWMSSADFT